MTIPEFSDQFDVRFNNITSNQAPGLDEYEKSLFLTTAEKEIVKNYFTANSKGNTVGQGFDDSAKRQADFSVLMKTSLCSQVPDSLIRCTSDGESITIPCTSITYTKDGVNKDMGSLTLNVSYIIKKPTDGDNNVTEDTFHLYDLIGTDLGEVSGYPYTENGRVMRIPNSFQHIDTRSSIYSFPDDVYIVVNETLRTSDKKQLQIVPLKFDEYTRLMSKPFQRPLKHQAWRLMNSGTVDGTTGASTKCVEIITNSWDENKISSYNIRYVRVPEPIILADLDNGLTIDGKYKQSDKCEIDPILHEDILQRAVELAKIAWTATGQDNAQLVMQSGTRSE